MSFFSCDRKNVKAKVETAGTHARVSPAKASGSAGGGFMTCNFSPKEMRAEKKIHCRLPFEWSVLRWSTVSWRISAFSSLAEPCFSKADGTRRLSSVKDELILSRRFFSMTPRLFLRVMSWQLSFSIDEWLWERICRSISHTKC